MEARIDIPLESLGLDHFVFDHLLDLSGSVDHRADHIISVVGRRFE